MGDLFVAAHEHQIPADRLHVVQRDQQLAVPFVGEVGVVILGGVLVVGRIIGEVLRILL